MPRYLLFTLVTLFAVSSGSAAEPDRAGIEFFEKKIRPVLIESCYRCHSEEAAKMKKVKGDLLLDTREGVRRGGEGGPILDAKNPKDSRLLKAIRHEAGLEMPPSKKLPDAVIADFVKWVELGAPDPREGKAATAKRVINIDEGRKFWAFQPLTRAEPPKVQNAAAQAPIDRFILARLEAQKLGFNAPADNEKLIRRAHFDLVGLPPTSAEIDAFVKDAAPDAFERLIDRLLQSERYGERWARHWLDVARFAESGGYEFDGDRPGAYHYRDFVIKAFNQDMPYDQFVRWQLAGDQLKPSDYFATSATGFVVAGPYPGQTTAKTLEPIRYDHLDDMVTTIGSSLLGLTLGCARCHDHKFDPIPTQDYYRLVAAFGRIDSANLPLDPNPEIYRKAKADFDQAHAPLVAARDKFVKEEFPARFQKWAATELPKPTATWQILEPVSFTSKVALKKLEDNSLLATPIVIKGPKTKRPAETYTIVAHTQQKNITAIRLEGLSDKTLPKAGPGLSAEGNFVLSQIQITAAPLQPPAPGKPKVNPVPVKLKATAATFEQPEHAAANAVIDKSKGWSIAGAAGKDHAAVFETEVAVGFDGGTVLTITLKFPADDEAFGRVRLALSTATKPVAISAASAAQNVREIQVLLEPEKGQVTDKNREAVIRWFRALDTRTNEVHEAVDQHNRQAPQPKLFQVFAAQTGRGGAVHFLTRGEVLKKAGVAAPGFVQVAMSGPEQRWISAPQAPTDPRIALGNWLTDSQQGAGHLLARVMVNRVWQHHFGRGIVGTPNDFGSQGERPTHPELLDWLAGEFIRGGWKLKPLHKLIMTSAAYRQGSATNDAGAKADPNDRLLWRYPTRRLEAEAIRDAMLTVSGSLDATMYGPGTLDGNSPRRSIYLTVKRSRMIPFLQLFDAPEAAQSQGERPATTVASQALAMMNSPFVRQRAEKVAQKIRPKTPDTLPQAIDDAYLVVLNRRPAPAERERMLDFIRKQVPSADPGGKGLELALTDFCQVLMCSNEFIYVD
ncbi:hypothetical protein AYO40_05460 [Planctomycetaceae bacterium SCGC AG-212-D15]|nr:hypothetical protein AYO40_05460 [Planctomycetaceae bacterium SCGC AG-212-D15]